ncbi:uncharacterized protein LOC135843215 [Planococcus citri]|uniref:uncharacterized protein LOC135843215 n=1 Tax=Planococcus citri TaxID=170843 RepID=UPI0031F80A24
MQFHWYFCSLFVFLKVLIFVYCEREPLCVYGPDAVELNRRFVREHNDLRRKHGAPLLHVNLDLAEDSTDWSLDLAEENMLKRSKSDGVYGENLYWSSDLPDKFNVNEISPVQSWYSQSTKYNGNFKIETRDFTQMIWASTSEVGCGACSGSGGTYVICRYAPAGNIRGKFKQNVLPPVPPDILDPKGTSGTPKGVTPTGSSGTPNPNEDSSILTPLLYALSIAIVVFALSTVVILLFITCYYSQRFFQIK